MKAVLNNLVSEKCAAKNGAWLVLILVLAVLLSAMTGCGGSGDAGSESAPQSCPPTCGDEVTPSDSMELIAEYSGSNFFVEILDVAYIPHREIAYLCTNAKGLLGVDLSDPTTVHLPWIEGVYDVPEDVAFASLGSNACQYLEVLEGEGDEPDVVVVTNRGNEYAPNGFIALLTAPTITDGFQEQAQFPLRTVHHGSGARYEGFEIHDGILYVAARGGGFEIFSITRDSLEFLGSVTNFYDAMDVTLQWPYAFVTDAGGGVAAVDVSDPLQPEMVSYYPLNGVIRDAEMLDETTVILSAGSTGVYAMDMLNPANPVPLSHIDTHGTALQISTDGPYVHVANWEDVVTLDFTDREHPFLAASETGPTTKAWPRYLAIASFENTVLTGEWNSLSRYQFHPGAVGPEVRPEFWELSFGNVTTQAETRALVLYNDGFQTLEMTVDSIPTAVMSVVPESLTIPPGEAAVVEVTVGINGEAFSEKLGFATNDVDESVFQVFVVGNQEGPGVGDPFPDSVFQDPDTGDPVPSGDVFAGKTTLLTYFSSF